jgi:hypothetical protein
VTRWERLRLRIEFAFADARNWLERFIYAQHNARVIVGFEDRMSSVIYAATGGMMSKPYYTTEAMLAQIDEARQREYDEAYQEGRRDLAEELGVTIKEPA